MVDDHVSFAEMLELTLRPALAGDPGRSGRFPEFVRASSVAEGMRCLSEDGPFDLVVIDLILPDGDGTEVVREVKSQSAAPPVAVLSARQDASEALEVGADDVISKSAPLTEIVASIARLAGPKGHSGSPHL